ncbi:MAG: hypothetical protein A2098_02415 [Chlamydiae bacterium GWF2_49_8]|nr:MAG: hypothetical protein A2098_02415 [Chlamydiae bacterium GWF2_49_8]
MEAAKKKVGCKGKYLGDYEIPPLLFSGLKEALKEFQEKAFLDLGERERNNRINEVLLSLICQESSCSFLLIAIIHFIDEVKRANLLEHYSISHFELWLNQFSGLSSDENYRIRAKIVGKHVPRAAYQTLFPIGRDKIYPGSHFVTAHSSPDVDTTIASFWGWVDAFGARVSEGMHIWNVPGGPPSSQMEIPLLFHSIFGSGIFDHIAKTRSFLSLSSLDLMNQKGMLRKKTEDSFLSIDQERDQKAVVLVDDAGRFIGDWLPVDVEEVRLVVNLLSICLRWFASNLHVQLISLFGREDLSASDLPKFIHSFFAMKIVDAPPMKDFTEKQCGYLRDSLVKVLHLPRGLGSSFEEYAHAMKRLGLVEFEDFIDLIESLQTSALFDSKGRLQEDRPTLFKHLEKIVRELDRAIASVRTYLDSIGIGFKIKTEVFGYLPQMISYRADLEEVRQKMDGFPYLTVTFPAKEEGFLPLGVVHAAELYRTTLGTVTLRDFCNREEMRIPSYLEVISVIDHHKSALLTTSAPVAYIGDAQSTNVVVAELAFRINDQYSMGAMSLDEIEKQMEEVQKDLVAPSSKRILQRLLQRRLHAERKGEYFVDPVREFVEYLHFLYAIFDDTDLLSKLSMRDVLCVISLINRLKSLLLGREVEIICVDDLLQDGSFVEQAAQRILQHSDVYSLYRKIYLSKEKAVEENIKLCVEGKSSSFFADTKEQNGCCRVGQAKMFSRNVPLFFKHVDPLRTKWLLEAIEANREKSELDLHLLMISTIPSAEDLFAGEKKKYLHKDELWLWIPATEEGIEHLKGFLNAFSTEPVVVSCQKEMEVEFFGENAKELEAVFQESFLPIPNTQTQLKEKTISLAVLRFPAGRMNSRKEMVTPFLPRLVI